MKKLLGKFKFFKMNNKGQGATEYILLVAVVVGLVVVFKNSIKQRLEKATNDVGTQIQDVTAP